MLRHLILLLGTTVTLLCAEASPATAARTHGALSASPFQAVGSQAEAPQTLPQPVMPTLPPVGKQQAQQLNLTYLLAQRTTNYHHASLSQTKNIELLAKRLNGVVVKPGETFSYYTYVGPYTAGNGYHWGRAFMGDRIVPSMGGGVCQGASTLYSVVLRTGLPVLERHNHSLTVPYLPPGEDATVAGTYLNFKFKNSRDTPVMIAAAANTSQRLLTVALWGAQAAPVIKVHHDVLEQHPYRIVKRTSSNLAPGQSKVLFPGQMGARVKTWLEIQTTQGTVQKSVSVDNYLPSPRIIEVGPSAPESQARVPAAGDLRVVQ